MVAEKDCVALLACDLGTEAAGQVERIVRFRKLANITKAAFEKIEAPGWQGVRTPTVHGIFTVSDGDLREHGSKELHTRNG